MLISLIRTVILYIVVIAVMRLLGKRQIGELEPSELAVTILVSELAAIPMQDSAQPLLSGLMPIAVLLALGLLTSVITVESPTMRRLICGRPSIIITDGKMDQREIRRLRLSVDEIGEELRLKDIDDLQDVRYGIIETNGKLSIILHDGAHPACRRDLHISTSEPHRLTYTVIANGHLVQTNMKALGITSERIRDELRKRNLSDIKDVFYMSCDETGKLRVIPNEMQVGKQ